MVVRHKDLTRAQPENADGLTVGVAAANGAARIIRWISDNGRVVRIGPGEVDQKCRPRLRWGIELVRKWISTHASPARGNARLRDLEMVVPRTQDHVVQAGGERVHAGSGDEDTRPVQRVIAQNAAAAAARLKACRVYLENEIDVLVTCLVGR